MIKGVMTVSNPSHFHLERGARAFMAPNVLRWVFRPITDSENRIGNDKRAYDVDENEGCTSIFTDHVGKSPDVAESDGGSSEGHYHGSAAAEVLSVRHIRLIRYFASGLLGMPEWPLSLSK